MPCSVIPLHTVRSLSLLRSVELVKEYASLARVLGLIMRRRIRAINPASLFLSHILPLRGRYTVVGVWACSSSLTALR